MVIEFFSNDFNILNCSMCVCVCTHTYMCQRAQDGIIFAWYFDNRQLCIT